MTVPAASRAPSSRCSRQMPVDEGGEAAGLRPPELRVPQVDVVDDLGDRAQRRILAQRASRTSNVQRSPSWVNSASNMSKRARRPWGCTPWPATNLSLASGSMNRRISQALAMRSTCIPLAGHPGSPAEFRRTAAGVVRRAGVLGWAERVLRRLQQPIELHATGRPEVVDRDDLVVALANPRQRRLDLRASFRRQPLRLRQGVDHPARPPASSR